MILQGEIVLSKDGYDLCYIGHGGFFGEELLLKKNLLEFTATVKSNKLIILALVADKYSLDEDRYK